MVCLPADGLKSREPNAGRDRAHVVLLPTFPILRAGESHNLNRKNLKTKFPKLLELLDPGQPL